MFDKTGPRHACRVQRIVYSSVPHFELAGVLSRSGMVEREFFQKKNNVVYKLYNVFYITCKTRGRNEETYA